MIYNKDPIDVLYDFVKSLAKSIPIYKESMPEDDNSIPKSYILLRSQVSDETEVYGDGECLIRIADCDILLISKGIARDSTDLHNINKSKVKECLKSQKINFTQFNFGYDSNSKTTQHTFTVEVCYFV